MECRSSSVHVCGRRLVVVCHHSRRWSLSPAAFSVVAFLVNTICVSANARRRREGGTEQNTITTTSSGASYLDAFLCRAQSARPPATAARAYPDGGLDACKMRVPNPPATKSSPVEKDACVNGFTCKNKQGGTKRGDVVSLDLGEFFLKNQTTTVLGKTDQ